MNEIVIHYGNEQRIFRRDKNGVIVYDTQAFFGDDGGYPYVTLERDVKANDKDLKRLLEQVLPKQNI